jgi:inner membrane protein
VANMKQHMLIGAATSAASWLVYCHFAAREVRLGELLLATGIGVVAGIAPDLLEPAVNPHHRRFFHSFAAAGLLAQATREAWKNDSLPQETKLAASLASAAYFSHLLADAYTPRGLPLI